MNISTPLQHPPFSRDYLKSRFIATSILTSLAFPFFGRIRGRDQFGGAAKEEGGRQEEESPVSFNRPDRRRGRNHLRAAEKEGGENRTK